MTEEKKKERKRAYQYIAFIAETYLGAPPNFSHKKLAEVLAISDDDRFSIEIALNRLKDGKENPSPKFIAALKEHFGPSIPGEFDYHLVTPFLTDP